MTSFQERAVVKRGKAWTEAVLFNRTPSQRHVKAAANRQFSNVNVCTYVHSLVMEMMTQSAAFLSSCTSL